MTDSPQPTVWKAVPLLKLRLPLLEVLEAKGLVLWVADNGAGVLRPSLSHGYPDKVVQRLGALQISADNVTSLAFRSMQAQTLNPKGKDASNALAACEVLARLIGNPGYENPYTEKVDEWVATHPQTPSPGLLARANAVINRILGDNSELKDLWAESDENSNWLASVDDLRHRLRR